MKFSTRQNPEELFVPQDVIKFVKLKCCGIEGEQKAIALIVRWATCHSICIFPQMIMCADYLTLSFDNFILRRYYFSLTIIQNVNSFFTNFVFSPELSFLKCKVGKYGKMVVLRQNQ